MTVFGILLGLLMGFIAGIIWRWYQSKRNAKPLTW